MPKFTQNKSHGLKQQQKKFQNNDKRKLSIRNRS